MKGVKNILLIGLFLGITQPLTAQILIGPKVGFQVSNVIYKDKAYKEDHTTHFKPGYNAGVVLNYKVNNTYSLHTELFYSRKGKVDKHKDYDFKNTSSYHYIDLPLMLRISKHRKIKKQNVEFYGNVGPSFGYWMGGKGVLRSSELREVMDTDKMKYTIKYEEGATYGESLYVPEPNRLQIEISIGGGVIFDMAKGQSLMVDLRYGMGIGHTYLGKREGGDFGLSSQFGDNFEAVNQVISLSVAYLFELEIRQILTKGKTIKK